VLAWGAADTSARASEAEAKAREILGKAREAVGAVGAVSYTATTTPGGVAESFFSPARGRLIMVGWNGMTPLRFYAHVKTVLPGSDQAIELTGGSDGRTFFLVDHRTKRGYENADPAVMGPGASPIRGLGIVEFVESAPFEDELQSAAVELVGTEEIDDHWCYKIRVIDADGHGESIWYFDKTSYLPRRRDQWFNIPDTGEGTLIRTVSDLEVNPEIDPVVFKMDLPADYERIDSATP
jgi:hypothetical protein